MWDQISINDLELRHHGIKGQKWGVRRFQNKDGSLTPAGKKRYDNSDKTSKPKRYDKLYSKYKSSGYSDEDAARLAKGQLKTERILIGIGAVAAATAIAYGTYKMTDNRMDKFISSKQVMQTVHKEDAADRLSSGNPFYATYKKADHTIYASKVFSHFGESSKVTQFYTDEGVKVASRNTGRKVLDDLLKSNEELRKYTMEDLKLAGKSSKDRYDIFNQKLVFRTGGKDGIDHDKFHNMFYDELKKRGYGAVIDVNDSKIEGFTFKPVIMFDNQVKRIISSTKATAEDLSDRRTLKAISLVKKKKLLDKPLSDPVVAGAAIVGGYSTVITSIGAHDYVRAYKLDHPNTKLSDFQITTMYLNNVKLDN
jgi:hypothetical protein